MKKAKHLILEIIILVAITASLIGVYFVYKGLNEIKPEDSTTYETKNYSADKHIVIKKDIAELEVYNIPELDKVVNSYCKYNYFITATDNYINTITEIISIKYDTANPEFNPNPVINYCNSYDEIENNYQLDCTYNNYSIDIKNIYYLNENYNETIKTKKFTIKPSIKNQDKLSELIEKLEKEEIEYKYVDIIQ